MRVCLIILICTVFISACETPGSKPLQLRPQLDLSVLGQSERKGELAISLAWVLENASTSTGMPNRRSIALIEPDKLLRKLFDEGFQAQGWQPGKANPDVVIPAIASLNVEVKTFDVYLVSESVQDTMHADFKVTLKYQRGEKTLIKTIKKHQQDSVAIKAQEEHVIRFAEDAMANLVESIIQKNYFAELEEKN